jgi:hypothetical protein
MQIIKGKMHWKVWHSKIGLVVTIAAMLAAIVGTVSFRRTGILAKLPAHVQPLVKATHRYSGPVIWLVAMANMLTGLQTNGAGPRWMLHIVQAAGLIALTAAQFLLLLQGNFASADSFNDAGKLV